MNLLERIKWTPPYNAVDGDGDSNADGDNGGNQDGLGNFLNNLNDDGSLGDAGDDGADANNNQNSDVNNAGDSDTNGDNADDNNTGGSKADQAFAQMRIQNKQLAQQNQSLNSMVKKLADAMGIDTSNDEAMLKGLNDDALEKISKRDGIPKDYLERMERLEGENNVARKERIQNNAIQGFRTVAQQYEVDQTGLEEFARRLDAAGINAFEQDNVDLIEQYERLYRKEIMQAEIDKAVQAALTKDGETNQHSSTPGKNKGRQDNSNGEKVTTVTGLRNVLSNINI